MVFNECRRIRSARLLLCSLLRHCSRDPRCHCSLFRKATAFESKGIVDFLSQRHTKKTARSYANKREKNNNNSGQAGLNGQRQTRRSGQEKEGKRNERVVRTHDGTGEL